MRIQRKEKIQQKYFRVYGGLAFQEKVLINRRNNSLVCKV